MKQFLRQLGALRERSSVERKAMAAFGDPIERIMVSFPTHCDHKARMPPPHSPPMATLFCLHAVVLRYHRPGHHPFIRIGADDAYGVEASAHAKKGAATRPDGDPPPQ